MSSLDLLQLALWLGVLAGGLTFAILLRRAEVPATYVRDLVHVGASVWVFGWRGWDGALAPTVLSIAALAGVLALPFLAGRIHLATHIMESLSGGDERWSGIVAYVLAYALLTPIGGYGAACALLALSWGDGIGGFVGKKYGRVRYRAAWGKEKSLEGTIAVAAATLLGSLAASALYGVEPRPVLLVSLALAAALSEALAPRASDNLAVPASVLLAARVFD